jgi:hypothetical protein
MKKHLFTSFLSLLCLSQLVAQEEYIGLSRAELNTLTTMAADRGNSADLQRLTNYQAFLNDIDTLYQVFSTSLIQAETSAALKAQLNARLNALDGLSYFGMKYREYKRADNQVEAQLNLAQYYSSLEKLELKDYFMALAISESPLETSNNQVLSYQAGFSRANFGYYMGMGFNYSIVSFVSGEVDLGSLEESRSDNSIGGLARDFFLGISYQLNPQFSGFLELGFSGQSLNNSTEILFLDPGVPEGAFTYTVTRNVQHRYTDLRLGGSYQLDKLQLQLGLQFSFLNALEMNYEFDDSFSDETTSNEYDPEEDYGFNKTRSFVMLGANYPLYAFNIAQKRASLDAFVRLSISLSSVIDKDSEQNFFNDFEKFNNNLIHLGLSLRL